MIKDGKQAERDAVLKIADDMCLAARTAPKARGIDTIHTAVVTDADKDALADTMERIGKEKDMAFLVRDAGNVRVSEAVVLVGAENKPRGLNEGCQYCGFDNCLDCLQKGGRCAFTSVDLGIATDSAVMTAAQNHVDNRIMFSIGVAALDMKLLGDKVVQIFGIPLSASGKSPFFDRK